MIAVAVVTAIPSFAVTDKEMEQARAIAAKHYLRYANNGSDYLDKLNPSSVAELSKSLKAKEKENIKSFNAVTVPKDYASWDKSKLVEYWSSTFFRSPGLKEDGKKCLSVLARNLNKINVGAPSSEPKASEPAKPADEPKAATPAKPNDDKQTNTSASAAPASQTGETTVSNETAPQNTEVNASEEELVNQAVAQAEADSGIEDEQPKKSSNTGWYIGILIVLVGVVIWLVMYASKSMKETGASLANNKAGEKEIREIKKAAKEEQNKMREQYANSLISKNDEIKQLMAQNETLERELDSAKREAEALRRELSAAKREISNTMQSNIDRPAPQPLPQAKPRHQAERTEQEQRQAHAPQRPQTSPARPGGLPPVVFLGYVNQKGLFVKASRTLNTEASVYRMDIPDGHHGLFRVVNDPDILDRLLDNTSMWLEGGCVIENPEDADIAAEIVTLQPGEALFNDNICRVTKKARIKFV